ncbi:MAG TPA: NAD(P)/FAD-dependent oxidoreductase [Thermoanaerobaculia bacterium]
MSSDSLYDCVIIGGGPAGLTAAIFLGRYRRRILLLDAGEPRNRAARAIHGFLGQHDIPPAELLRRGRAEAEAAGVEIQEARVTKAEKVGDVFELTTDAGTVRGRRILLAYGVRDERPDDIPDFDRYYGSSIYHCPDCDGYECRDRTIGVIGWGKKVAGLALKLLQWTDDVVVFTHGHAREWNEEQHSKILAANVTVKDEAIVALEGNGDRVSGAVLSTGECVKAEAFFFTLGVHRSTDLAEQLGCKVDPEKPNVIVDDHRKTTVEGVWAAGDLVAGAQLAITSAADGAIAAIAINKSLLPPSRHV